MFSQLLINYQDSIIGHVRNQETIRENFAAVSYEWIHLRLKFQRQPCDQYEFNPQKERVPLIA